MICFQVACDKVVVDDFGDDTEDEDAEDRVHFTADQFRDILQQITLNCDLGKEVQKLQKENQDSLQVPVSSAFNIPHVQVIEEVGACDASSSPLLPTAHSSSIEGLCAGKGAIRSCNTFSTGQDGANTLDSSTVVHDMVSIIIHHCFIDDHW
jgi:hypothetical protein